MTKIITILLIFASSLTVWGQTLLETTGKTPQKVVEFETRKAVTDYQSININLDILKEGQGKISFWGIDETVFQTKLTVRSFKNFSWFGSNKDKTTSIILTVADNDIQGLVTHKTEVYRIETVGDIYYITKIDHSKYPSEECGVGSKNNDTNAVPNNPFNEDSISYQQKMISGEPFTCRLRLLVLYTPAAKNAVSNISNTIQLAVDEMKQSFINSNVYREVELVYVGETNYTEVNTPTDLNRFYGNGDNYIDEVHNFRTKHQADICVLIAQETDYCGAAKYVKVSASYAFCVVDVDCATGYYSFAHEIGHIIGTRHDPYIDNSNTPYPYGHGYVASNNQWRTIMAYGDACGGCTRIQYWSNPNVSYGGLPMGTTSTHNNARVLNEKIPNAMSYLQPANTVTVQNADVAAARDGDIIAKSKVETSGTVAIQNGQSYSFRSGGTVVLEPGFTAEVGSNFVAEIVEVTDCGQPDGEASNYSKTDEFSNYASESSAKFISDFVVYPNPTNDFITVNLNVTAKIDVDFKVCDYTGKTVKKIGKYTLTTEKFSRNFNLLDLTSGVYFIVVTFDNQEILNHKIIKIK